MGAALSEIVAGAVQLPDATSMDGELVVWDATGRLAFERLQNRLARRRRRAALESVFAALRLFPPVGTVPVDHRPSELSVPTEISEDCHH